MKFLVLTTGGTIASVPSDNGFIPSIAGDALLKLCPSLSDFGHEIEVRDLFSKDSSNMNPADWMTCAQNVRKRIGKFNGFVILHGTDTLAWTAAALSFLLGDAAPVVLSGSMISAGGHGSDADDNVSAALMFALQLAMYKRGGVSVAFAGKLIHGPKAMKLDTHKKDAFATVDYPLLGDIKDKGMYKVAWLSSQVPKFADALPWPKKPVFETNIALVPIFPGMRSSALDAIVDTSPRAVVLEAYGSGGVPFLGDSLLPSIERGVKLGIPFILRTQSPFGGTDPALYEVGRKAMDLGAMSARDMTREALMVKLMLLLPLFKGKKFKGKNLEEMLMTNFCDDVRE
ncbi:L-asparaginase 1 [Synergistales bacterium]|nr:L-asparaginase 1 [Synergistales bacterium]